MLVTSKEVKKWIRFGQRISPYPLRKGFLYARGCCGICSPGTCSSWKLSNSLEPEVLPEAIGVALPVGESHKIVPLRSRGVSSPPVNLRAKASNRGDQRISLVLVEDAVTTTSPGERL